MGSGALVWGPWRVDLITRHGRPILRVTHGRDLIGNCRTVKEALDLLTSFGVPVDRLIRERDAS